MKKVLAGVLLLAASLLLVAGCGDSKKKSADYLQKIQDKGVLVVATSADYPPYEFPVLEGGKNKIVGMDIDLAKAIAKGLGVKLEVKNMQFDSVLASVQSGKADMGFAGFSITDEHKKSVDFSIPYYHSGQVALINKKDADKYQKLSDFGGKQVLVQQGSIQNEVAKKQLPKSQVITTDAVPNGVMQVQSGKVSAMILDLVVAKGYADSNANLATAKAKFQKTGEEDNGAVLPKNSGKLKKEVDKIIKQQVASGKIDEYLKKNGEIQVKTAEDDIGKELK